MIRLRAGPNILEPLRYKKPVNDLQAKFSLQFGLSSILLRRHAGLREYTNFFVNSLEVKETIKKVETIHDPEIAKNGMEKMRSILEVELEDGRIIKRVAEKARGTPEKPLKNYELEEKFRECASFVLNKDETNMVLKKLRRTENICDIKELTRLLTPHN